MKISMVITTFNRAALLDHSLHRLATLTVPDEILVIDDGGDDLTAATCDRWADLLPLRYIYNHNPGTTICSMARNIGIKEAQHEWIVTSEPELIYLTDVIAQFKELHPTHPEQVISAAHITFAPAGWEPDRAPEGQVEIGWVAPHTALWKRQWLCEVGGWDESFPGQWGWDDTDLLTRLRINGIGQFICPDIRVAHQFHGLGADPGSVNEQHFRSKSFMRDESDVVDLIANRGIQWGSITPRS